MNAAAAQATASSLRTTTSTTVTFDVSGTPYKVSRTLLERHPNIMLTRLVSEEWQGERSEDSNDAQEEEKAIFIERDGDMFKYVLQYMRDGRVCLPAQGVSKQALLLDLQYYGFENISSDAVLVDCPTGDAVKHLKSLEDNYNNNKRELEDLLDDNGDLKKAKLDSLQDEFESRRLALITEYADKKNAESKAHDDKKKELRHRQGCLEVAHFFFKEFQAGRRLEVNLSKLAHSHGLSDLPAGLDPTEAVRRFVTWATSLDDSDTVVNDATLKEYLGNYGLEVDKCEIETRDLPRNFPGAPVEILKVLTLSVCEKQN